DAADVLVDRQPAVGGRLRDRLLRIRVGEAGEVPAGVDEGVERVRLPCRIAVTRRAFDVLPGRMAVQRISGGVEGHVLGQLHRQLLGRYRAARRAVNDRNRAAPVPLVADASVAQTIDARALALA